MTSMTSFSSGGLLLASSDSHFLLQMFLLSKLGTFNYVDYISHSFLNSPERFIIWKYPEKDFLSGLVAFFGHIVRPGFVCFGSKLVEYRPDFTRKHYLDWGVMMMVCCWM